MAVKFLTDICMSIAHGYGFVIDALPDNKIRMDVPYSFNYPSTFVPMVWGPDVLTDDEFVSRILSLSEHVAIRYAELSKDRVSAFS